MLCKNCKGSECVNPPTTSAPFELTGFKCSACGGKGCQKCWGRGVDQVDSCPKRMLTADIFDLMMATDLAEHGSWPVSGGWLDQTQSCVEGTRVVTSDRNRFQSEVLKRG